MGITVNYFKSSPEILNGKFHKSTIHKFKSACSSELYDKFTVLLRHALGVNQPLNLSGTLCLSFCVYSYEYREALSLLVGTGDILKKKINKSKNTIRDNSLWPFI